MPFAISQSKNPQHFAATARRLANFGMALPDHIVNEGREWYPAVREATRQGAKDIGISAHAGAGIVAAVSPNMDFDNNNIHALGEITQLRPEHWAMINRSDEQVRGGGKRIPEVTSMMREVAPSISAAYDANLVKAHRILNGENFESVLNRRTSPKANSFARNIWDPNSTDVTVDGRHHDIIANSRMGWTNYNRGIGSAGLTRGRSRYEEMEEATRVAASIMSDQDPRFAGASGADAQAVMWLGGKQVERGWNPNRKQGDARRGQPYMSETGRPIGL